MMKKKIEKHHFCGEKKIYEFQSVDLAKTFSEWKSPLLSLDYMFIQTYRELNDVLKKLEEKEKEIEFHNTEMNSKWNELKKKQEDFLNDVENYNKFFIENEHKCQRVHEKVNSEIEFQKKCEQNIETARKRIQYLEELENNMKNSVHSLKPFHDYLDNIAEQIEYFADVSEMINYYILLYSETKLQETFINHLLGSEQLHTQLLQNLKAKMNMLIQQTSELFEEKNEYRVKTNDLNQWQEKLVQKRKQVSCTNEENILMEQACDNIFQKLRKWKKTNLPTEEDDDKKLIFIENSINELQKAVQLAYKLSYKDNISCISDSSFITEKRVI